MLNTLSRKNKFLTISEIPVEVQCAYDISSQKLEYHPTFSCRQTMIDRICLNCGKQDHIRATEVRQAAKDGDLTGLCKTCSYAISHPQPKGDKSYNWRGGRVEQEGYIMIQCPGHPRANIRGYVFEHRLVMEEYLDRYLLPIETVHHKNGMRADNRLENLELWNGKHGDGFRYKDMTSSQVEKLIGFLQNLLDERKQ